MKNGTSLLNKTLPWVLNYINWLNWGGREKIVPLPVVKLYHFGKKELDYFLKYQHQSVLNCKVAYAMSSFYNQCPNCFKITIETDRIFRQQVSHSLIPFPSTPLAGICNPSSQGERKQNAFQIKNKNRSRLLEMNFLLGLYNELIIMPFWSFKFLWSFLWGENQLVLSREHLL